ncbi:MAG: outer membrane beta-barrel protein [Bdellovibrionales bacterium]|nr:outer membrane beta-barrel protein [Bdellovibrionales bacterium]
MKRLRHLWIACFLISGVARAGFEVGAQVNVLDFFILPSNNSGLTTSAQFGLGAIYGGYSLGDTVSLRAFLSQDNTGRLTGTGTLYGQSFNATGTFKVFTFGGELLVAPPMFPLYLKAGIGIGSLNASDFGSPFDQLSMSFAAHFGLGIAFNLMKTLRFHLGLDGVWLQLNPGNSGITGVVGFPYFKTILGVTFKL